MTRRILDFLQPFDPLLLAKKIRVQVIEMNEIPNWACADWDKYEGILYHLMQNAIKFNKDNGSIKVIFSYHPFESEQEEEVPANRRLFQQAQRPLIADNEEFARGE